MNAVFEFLSLKKHFIISVCFFFPSTPPLRLCQLTISIHRSAAHLPPQLGVGLVHSWDYGDEEGVLLSLKAVFVGPGTRKRQVLHNYFSVEKLLKFNTVSNTVRVNIFCFTLDCDNIYTHGLSLRKRQVGLSHPVFLFLPFPSILKNQISL